MIFKCSYNNDLFRRWSNFNISSLQLRIPRQVSKGKSHKNWNGSWISSRTSGRFPQSCQPPWFFYIPQSDRAKHTSHPKTAVQPHPTPPPPNNTHTHTHTSRLPIPHSSTHTHPPQTHAYTHHHHHQTAAPPFPPHNPSIPETLVLLQWRAGRNLSPLLSKPQLVMNKFTAHYSGLDL